MSEKPSWSFLAHWLPALAHRPTRVDFPESIPDHALKIFTGALEITPVMTHNEPNYVQIWQEQCEGMELLAMLVRVDQAAAVEVIKIITLVDHSEMDWRGTPIEENFTLKYHIKIHQDDVLSRRPEPEPFFAVHVYKGTVKSKEAEELLAEDGWPELLQRARSAQTRTFIEELKIPIVLDIQLSLEQLLTPCIDAFVDAKTSDSLFALESVRYDISDKDVWSDWVEEWCQTIRDEGIPLAALRLSGGDPERPHLLPLLHRHVKCLASPFLGEEPSRSYPTSNLEVILDSPLGSNRSAGVFSLLAAQNSIETLRLRNLFSLLPSEEDEDEPEAYADRRKRDWRWFSFLFFTPFSSASFITLDFDVVKLTMEDIEAINAIRNAENPFSWLCPRLGDDTPREQPLQIAQVEADVMIEPTPEVEFPCDDEDLSWLYVSWIESNRGVLSQTCLLRVVDDEPSKPTVDVLVPGYGVCHVNRSNAKISPDSSLSKPADDDLSTGSFVPSMPAQVVSHVRISLDPDHEEEMDGLVPFVELFGECLSTLSIRSKFWPMINDANIHSIARACPILEELALDGVILSSLEVITDLFEVDKCEVNSLKLNNLCVAQTGDKTRLMTVISNPNSTFSLSLRRLTLAFPSSRSRRLQ